MATQPKTAEKKAYRPYSTYLKEKLGYKTYKLTLDAGFTCPNRDGTKAWGGCTFCDQTGSSSRAQDLTDSIQEQLLKNMEKQRKRFKAEKFIAYFQSFTNTYGALPLLKSLYDSACHCHQDIIGLAISTRPDCVDRDVLALIASYKSQMAYVSVEYGLQTIHNKTLVRINRAETVEDFYRAYALTQQFQLDHCIHVILDLPGETWDEQMATADKLAEIGVQGVKIHLLCAMEKTPLANEFKKGLWQPLDKNAYIQLICDFLERLHPDCVIHRVAGNGHRLHVVAPLWLQQKLSVMNEIDREFAKRGTRQGSKCRFIRAPLKTVKKSSGHNHNIEDTPVRLHQDKGGSGLSLLGSNL
ncbi:MAG: TIGR01212 family radical SAM protein [Cyanobacteria bacterium P01_H01_bin.74]